MSARSKEERAVLAESKAREAAERAAWARIEAIAHTTPIVGVLWTLMRKLERSTDAAKKPEHVELLQSLDAAIKDGFRKLGLEVPA